jgi:uncharacterized protein
VTGRIAVCDSGPLIALHQVERAGVLSELFAVVYAPPAVVLELRSVRPRPPWLDVRAPRARHDLPPRLGPGEREAIALAVELTGSVLLIDDRRARRVAERLGVEAAGTIRVLMLAKAYGLVDAVRDDFERLLRFGFFASRDVIDRALRELGE